MQTALWVEREGVVWWSSIPSTTFSHLHTPHLIIVSFLGLPTSNCRTTGEERLIYVGYQIYAGVCGAI